MAGPELLRNLPVPPGQVVGIGASILLDRFPVRLPGAVAAQRLIGAGAVVCGCALNGWALRERRRHENGRFDLERPQTLVTTGPYAITRNPMYVGWWLIHLGVGLFRGSGWVLVTVPAAAVGEHPGVLREERALAAAFGDQFARYARRVPRYLAMPPLGAQRHRRG